MRETGGFSDLSYITPTLTFLVTWVCCVVLEQLET